ncbi:MAG: hypothetical protein M3310_07730, partial [Actinomycetota bacterium]|nr:hypothetical protein [Actinomycetota bacterium]
MLIAVVAVAAALGAWRSWDDEPPQTVDEPIVGSAVVEPEQHLFADAVRARLDLIVDPERVDPGSVEVGANFAPYRQLRPVRVAREDRGSLVRLRYEYVLGCLAARCLPT